MPSPVLERLLDLPATIDKSQFVVQLANGVAHPEKVLHRYAVTPELQLAYRAALAHAKAALDSGLSNATYIDGTFGSGKSQFMAILSLILGGREEPWGHPKLQPILPDHGWVREKKLLRLHYHFVGAGSVEGRIFRGYMEQVEALHPGAKLPALLQTDAIFANASELRRVMGDRAFFGALNGSQDEQVEEEQGEGELAGWGDAVAEVKWDADRFAEACADRNDALRSELFSALTETLLPAVRETSGDFVDIDTGLTRIATHASGLGYDGVLLMLDELILWMAGRATNQEWLRSEMQKVAKLVETEKADRDVPIISFVARQRSIDHMVDGLLEGSGFQLVRDAGQYWESRFSSVKLPGRNLPAIVEVRVVCPKNDAARTELRQALEQVAGSAGQDWDALLGEQWDKADFARVFPFTPALVQVLVELSNYLQRERTGIRVLMEMLKGYLDDYRLGDVVPLGDLYDVLAAGQDPLDGQIKARFDLAKRLYRDELLRLVRLHNRTESRERCQRLREDHPVALGCANCPMSDCRTDNRLLKTLLIAELVPNIKLLRDLSASRLVALNHGTVQSFIPGEELTMAVERLRAYASDLGQLRIGDQNDPSVRIALDDLDVRPVLDKAREIDSVGQQRRRLRQLLFELMELDGDKTEQPLTVVFHETRRQGTVIFGNVRTLDDDTLRARDDEAFRLVIDYPFDEETASPQQDEERLQRFRLEANPTHTVVWLPSFFGQKVRRDLSDLVLVEAVLAQPQRYLVDFRLEDRERALAQFKNMQSQKRASVEAALLAAYGVSMQATQNLDSARRVTQHVHTLDASLRVSKSSHAQLGPAMKDLVDQLLKARYPDHPVFTKAVNKNRLGSELTILESLTEQPNERMPMSGNDLAQVSHAVALGLLESGRDSVTWNRSRLQQVRQRLDADRCTRPNRQQIVHAYDPGGRAGLTDEVKDFLVAAWATHERAVLQHDGKAVEPVICGKLPFDVEVVTPVLPTDAEWALAVAAAGRLFGLTARSGVATPRNVRSFAGQVREKCREAVDDRAHEVLPKLSAWADFFDSGQQTDRERTAADTIALLEGLSTDDDTTLVRALAEFAPARSEAAVTAHLRSAATVVVELEDRRNLAALAHVRRLSGAAAARILDEARSVLSADEMQSPLASRLRSLAERATLLTQTPIQTPTEVTQTPTEVTQTPSQTGDDGTSDVENETSEQVIGTGSTSSGRLSGQAAQALATAEMQSALDSAGQGYTLVIDWRIVPEEQA